MRDDDELEIAGTWRLQTVVAAEVDENTPFVVTLTFKDGYRASVNLYIAWPNGYDYDPDSLQMLAMKQHPGDPDAAPALRQ